MAKSWSGFVAQNQNVLEQWGVMEATSREIIQVLLSLPKENEKDEQDSSGTPDLFAGWPYDTES